MPKHIRQFFCHTIWFFNVLFSNPFLHYFSPIFWSTVVICLCDNAVQMTTSSWCVIKFQIVFSFFFFSISGIPVHPAIPILQLRLTNLVPFAKKPSQTIFTKKIESLQDIPNMPMTVDWATDLGLWVWTDCVNLK